ncbi:MAG TPA: POTRA domain-containing protein [Flavobacteriales bacterium]|nr:POTRA domain-containing protein [Flavobacteriales bacterium]HRE95580.1 POTRA domain-containing protein [Flavobacteriales bacterium]HRJ38566.1 POTRA domain-containing protein [Flavobacteriales bacterium]
MPGKRILILTILFIRAITVYSQHDSVTVARISISGNNKTKESIILREISFMPGQRFHRNQLSREIERSQSMLINTLLFNFVEVKEVPIDSVYSDVFIFLKERFYLWPIPVFKFADPNFNTWWLTKDFTRTNYGLVILKKNFRGRNEDLGAKVQLGYSKEFAATYRLPYFTKRQKLGGGLWASYVQNNEVTIGTKDNKRIFYTGDNGNSRDELSFRAYLSYRAKIHSWHTLEYRHNRIRVVDSVQAQSGQYLQNNAAIMTFPSLYYTLKIDRRDNKGYPLEGRYTQMEITKHGFFNVGQNSPNILQLYLLHTELFRASNSLFFAMQFRGKIIPTKNLPYYFQEGLGYQHYVRGYEYYVIDGQNFAMFRSNVKYRLFGPKIHDLDFLQGTNFSKLHYAFYLNLYIDAGYVQDRRYYTENPLANQMLYGTGIGLDFVSFYDKVIRFEYSMNKELEKGFFIHFIKPI